MLVEGESMSFRIEQGVPAPKKTGGNYAKYPWPQMGIGDSVFLDSTYKPNQIRSSLSNYSSRTDKQFVTRKEGSGLRVWRVE